MTLDDKLKAQLEALESGGSIKQTSNVSSEDKWKEYPEFKTKMGETHEFRLIRWPDGEVVKEVKAIRKLKYDESGKFKRDLLPMCPTQFGEKSALNDFIFNVLFEGDRKYENLNEVEKDHYKTLKDSTFWVFRGFVRGAEEFGPKIWKTYKKDVALDILRKCLDPEFAELGGFCPEENKATTKALDFKFIGVPAGEGIYAHKADKVEPGIRPKPLLPKDCTYDLSKLDEDNADETAPFTRITYQDSVQILQEYLSQFTDEESEDTEKYGSEPQTEVEKKLAALKEENSKNE